MSDERDLPGLAGGQGDSRLLARPDHISIRSTTSCAARTKSIATSIQMMLLIACGKLPIVLVGMGGLMCHRHRIAIAKYGAPTTIAMLAPRPFRPLRNTVVRE